jgi:hypothetical protein
MPALTNHTAVQAFQELDEICLSSMEDDTLRVGLQHTLTARKPCTDNKTNSATATTLRPVRDSGQWVCEQRFAPEMCPTAESDSSSLLVILLAFELPHPSVAANRCATFTFCRKVKVMVQGSSQDAAHAEQSFVPLVASCLCGALRLPLHVSFNNPCGRYSRNSLFWLRMNQSGKLFRRALFMKMLR